MKKHHVGAVTLVEVFMRMYARIETWDVGYYQISQALKGTGIADGEVAALKQAHDALCEKLLPKVYEYGFLNPDVEYYDT